MFLAEIPSNNYLDYMDSSQASRDGSHLAAETIQTNAGLYESKTSREGRIVRIQRVWFDSPTPGTPKLSHLALWSLLEHLRDHSDLHTANDLFRPPEAHFECYYREMPSITYPTSRRDVFVLKTPAGTGPPPATWLDQNVEQSTPVPSFGKWPHSLSEVYFDFDLDTLQIATHASPILGIVPKVDLARLRRLILPRQTVDVTEATELELAEVPTTELQHVLPGLAGQDNKTKEERLRSEIAAFLSKFCPRLERLELKDVTSCDLWAENADSRRSMEALRYHKSQAYPQNLVNYIESESSQFWNRSTAHSSLASDTSSRYCGVCAYAHPSYFHPSFVRGVAPDGRIAKQELVKTITVKCGRVMVVYEGFGFDYCGFRELRGLQEKGSLVQLQSVFCSLRRSFLHVAPAVGICPVTLCI